MEKKPQASQTAGQKDTKTPDERHPPIACERTASAPFIGRTRRVSIELIRRELKLSPTKSVGATAEAGLKDSGRDEREVQRIPSSSLQCPACASPWIVLSTGDKDSAIVRQALEIYGIHTQLSSAGEVFVCVKSFELHLGAFDATRHSVVKIADAGNDLAGGEDPDRD